MIKENENPKAMPKKDYIVSDELREKAEHLKEKLDGFLLRPVHDNVMLLKRKEKDRILSAELYDQFIWVEESVGGKYRSTGKYSWDDAEETLREETKCFFSK